MIRITIKDNIDTNDIKEIEISGHANYSEYGTDIVCASVSSMCITTINAIIRIKDDAIKYEESDGYLLIKKVASNNAIDELIDNLIDLLYDLEKQYKKYIEIRRCHL